MNRLLHYILICLFDLTRNIYRSNTVPFSTTDPLKPQFLLYLDEKLNVIENKPILIQIPEQNNYLLSNTSTAATYSLTSEYSFTAEISYTSIYSLTADISNTSLYSITANYSNLANISNTALYSKIAEYSLTSGYSLTAAVAYSLVSGASTDVNLDISPFTIPYTILTTGTSFPTNPTEYTSFYNIVTKELFVYLDNTWKKINWQKYVKSDWLYKQNMLRINPTTGGLEIQDAAGNWHEIIPTVGTVVYATLADYMFYIAPGQTFNGIKLQIAPVIAVNGVMYRGIYHHSYPGDYWFGIFPSGLLIQDGAGAGIGANLRTTYRNFVPIMEQAVRTYNWANFSIHIQGNRMFTTGVGYSWGDGPGEASTIGFGTFPITGYYLGVWCYEGMSITVDRFTLRREY